MSRMGWLQDALNGIAIAGEQRRTQEVLTALAEAVVIAFDVMKEVAHEHPGATRTELYALSAGHPRAAHLDQWTRSVVFQPYTSHWGFAAEDIMADVDRKYPDATNSQAWHLAMADPRAMAIDEIARGHLISYMAWRRDIMRARAAQAIAAQKVAELPRK
jgi:hypothetical protein